MSDSKKILENQVALFGTFAGLNGVDECQRFFLDLCTPAELTAMADRWKAAQMLQQGLPYREIYKRSGVSTATVTRVARCLRAGSGGYRLVLDRLAKGKNEKRNSGKST